MKRTISVLSALILIIAALVVSAGCEEKNGYYDDIDIPGSYSGSGGDGDVSQFVASGSDILPDGAIVILLLKEY